jgi:hypothetical protein
MPIKDDERRSQQILDSPGAWQMTAWTLALAKNHQFQEILSSDPHLFGLFYAACASAVAPPEELSAKVTSEIIASDLILPTLKELQRQFGDYTTGAFARTYLEGLSVYYRITQENSTYNSLLSAWRETALQKSSEIISYQERNLRWIANLLNLNDVESNVLAFQLNRHRPGFAQLYDLLMRADDMTQIVLSTIFEVSYSKIVDALSEEGALVRSGLVTVTTHPLRLDSPSPHLRAVLSEAAEDESEFLERFVKPLTPISTTSSLARLDERDRDILLQALRLPAKINESGVHVLVYGPSAVDKRDMLARLFEAEDLDAYTVVGKNVPPSELPTWVYIAQRYIEEEDPEAVLIIERADQALAVRNISMMSIFGIVDDEPDRDDEGRASDSSLTSSPVRCVWLSDRARQLSERNLGAFSFHCEALPGSRTDRRTRIQQIITDLGLSKDLERHLSTYSLLGDRQVKTAAELAQRLRPHQPLKGADASTRKALKAETVKARELVIRRAVSQSQKVLGRDHTEQLRDSVTAYSLDNLNVAGKFTPAQILDALRLRPRGSLCFHGIPGAGKTQLAEYMAVELDLPLIVRSASDILSKWLGESEQHIAQMFEEAEAEGALLFLDEADSFLRDRALARAEYSVTQVNELLQKMERFEGIFIAATNLMDVMDAAAMRRFTWKLEFLPLRDEQAWAMLRTEAGISKGQSKQHEALRAQLLAIKDLAPGDFATVKRQANMLGVPLTPEEWIEQLQVEAKAKMNGLRRQQLGFRAEV